MAAPTLQAEGTITAVTAGALAPTIPTHQADDILIARAIVWVPASAGAAASIPTPTGSITWTLMGSQVQQPAGTADGWAGWWWGRADSAGETISWAYDASWDSSGTDHVFAGVVDVVRGAITSGTPYENLVQSAALTAANGQIPAYTVSGSERLVLAMGNSMDNNGMGAAAPFTANTNRTDATGTDSGFKNWLKNNQSSGAAATTTTTSAPAQGAYVITVASFLPPVTALGTVLNTDTTKYAGSLGAEVNTSTYNATTLGAALNTDAYP